MYTQNWQAAPFYPITRLPAPRDRRRFTRPSPSKTLIKRLTDRRVFASNSTRDKTHQSLQPGQAEGLFL